MVTSGFDQFILLPIQGIRVPSPAIEAATGRFLGSLTVRTGSLRPFRLRVETRAAVSKAVAGLRLRAVSRSAPSGYHRRPSGRPAHPATAGSVRPGSAGLAVLQPAEANAPERNGGFAFPQEESFCRRGRNSLRCCRRRAQAVAPTPGFQEKLTLPGLISYTSFA